MNRSSNDCFSGSGLGHLTLVALIIDEAFLCSVSQHKQIHNMPSLTDDLNTDIIEFLDLLANDIPAGVVRLKWYETMVCSRFSATSKATKVYGFKISHGSYN